LSGLDGRIRSILADHNADAEDLFSVGGYLQMQEVPLEAEDRFVVEQLFAEWRWFQQQLRMIDAQLEAFAETAPLAEVEARSVLHSIPQVGPVTIDVVISELGDVRRFRSAKQICAYAGLAPGYRESGGHRKDLGITKEGSPRLRWVLIEAAWRLVARSPRWRGLFERLAARRGKKRAITAVARRLLCVMAAMLRSGSRYRAAA
jgi:transposase